MERGIVSQSGQREVVGFDSPTSSLYVCGSACGCRREVVRTGLEGAEALQLRLS